MRLAFFFENHVVGGGSKYVLDCINAVLARGAQVTLLSNRDALSVGEIKQLVAPLTQMNVSVFERNESVARLLGAGPLAAVVRKAMIFLSPLMLLLNVLECWRHLGRVRPEVLVACNGGYPAAESALAAVLAARLRNIRSVLVIMSQPAPRRRILPGYDRLLDGLVFAAVDAVVLNSERQAQVLELQRGAPHSKLQTVRNGIADVARPWASHTQIGHAATLGVACRLDPMKGLDHLIRAVALLDGRCSVRLRIVGDGPCRDGLQQLAKELGVSDRVELVGFRQGESLLAELEDFDLYVFPSLWEGLPYSLLEAMRAGMPIVSTDVGGIPEAIRNEEEALLVPPASPRALADAIDRILRSPELARGLGMRARRRYETLFSLEKMQHDFAAVVTAICDRSTPQPGAQAVPDLQGKHKI